MQIHPFSPWWLVAGASFVIVTGFSGCDAKDTHISSGGGAVTFAPQTIDCEVSIKADDGATVNNRSCSDDDNRTDSSVTGIDPSGAGTITIEPFAATSDCSTKSRAAGLC